MKLPIPPLSLCLLLLATARVGEARPNNIVRAVGGMVQDFTEGFGNLLGGFTNMVTGEYSCMFLLNLSSGYVTPSKN